MALRRSSLPPPVTLHFFFAPECVFCFGIVSFRSCILRRGENHGHVAALEEGRRLDLPDLLHVLVEAHEEVAPPLRMLALPAAEHDRDLDLRALVEEPRDMASLRLVVVLADLRSELDLLDVDLRLVLPRELRLLLLLVAVLAVVHDPRDRRIGLGCDFDQIEISRVCVLARLVCRLDPELTAVLVDQAHPRHPYLVVDPRLRLGAPRRLVERPSPRPQTGVTKSLSPSCLRPPSEMKKPPAGNDRQSRQPARLNPRDCGGRTTSPIERRGQEVRDGSVPACQGSRVASLARNSDSESVDCPPPRSRT